MNQRKTPEVAPVIICDVNLGILLDNLEVDDRYFTEWMRGEGVSESDIEATTIHISSDSVISDDENGFSDVKIGEYNRATRTVKVNIGSYVDVIKYEENNPEPGKIPDDDSVDQRASLKISETAQHETSHRVDDLIMGLERVMKEDFDYLRRTMPRKPFRSIVHRAMILTRIPELVLKAEIQKLKDLQEAREKRDHDTYKNSPAEIRARQKAEKLSLNASYPILLTLKR